ncbi:MAG: DUF1844 domain-containing protein [Burkholderiales bacterium]
MPEDKEDPSGFKVVDRRTFDTEGTRRDDSPAAEEKSASRTEPLPENFSAAEEDLPFDSEEGPTNFDTLVSYLSTTAMFQLGLLPGPGGERIPVDLVNARRTIDLLEVLQEKTRGNLTPSEAKLLEDVLYELRLTFVEIDKRVSKRPR